MRIEIETDSYNERRYGKPYIAVMDLLDRKADPRWGAWIGQPGTEGLLEIEAAPGDIVMQGQKDLRKPRNSAPSYALVRVDGSLEWGTKVAIYKLGRAVQPAPTDNPLACYSDDEIRAEYARRGLEG